ncbi:SNF2 family N-terminal domain containing protein [Ditylenchus destructor]|nr:SNF2 family N-terminal domain containing protein [Ditylenchus destructor]
MCEGAIHPLHDESGEEKGERTPRMPQAKAGVFDGLESEVRFEIGPPTSKFLCKDTIEQRVLEMQEKQKALAKGVFKGAASKNLKKLTMKDLKFLFELDRRPAQVPTSSQMIKPVSSIAPSGSTDAGVVNNGQPNTVSARTLPIPSQYVFHP